MRLARASDVRVLARHDRSTPQGVIFYTADPRTGQGIEPAVTAAAIIIHCATSTRGDAEATSWQPRPGRGLPTRWTC